MLKLISPLMLFLIIGGFLSLHSTQADNPPAEIARPTTVSPPPRKRALLIGVSDYCPATAKADECARGGRYWWDLNSAADIDALKASLMTDFSFQADDIKTLTSNQDTTHENIVNTFQSFLIDQTKAGDIVYFHYSGHGARVPDDRQNGPNPMVGDEIDGLDESLVPSDYKTQQDGSNNIRDDKIGELLAKLKDKQPDSITITMDSCFSGTNTRGGEHLVRGADWTGPAPKVDTSRAQPESASGLLTRGVATQQGYVVISATNNQQLAGETNCNGIEMGLFTCALINSFKEAGENTTYRDVFEKINDHVLRNTRTQNPQLEGARDQRVMKLGAARPQPYVVVETVGSRIILKAGQLQGMTQGSRFNIHPKGANPKDTKPIAEAEISRVNPTTSILSLTSSGPPPKQEDLHLSRAVETLHNFGDQRLRVNAGELAKGQNGPLALKVISDLRMVNTSLASGEIAQVRICRGACPNEVNDQSTKVAERGAANMFTLMREDGSILRRLPDDVKLAAEIQEALEAEARWRYVKEVLKNDDRYINLKFRLVPVEMVDPSICDPQKDPDCDPFRDKPQPVVAEGGQPVLRGGDMVRLEFLNTGTFPVFVTVLDLRSDGTIGPIWPHPCIPLGHADENRIEISRDGKWKKIPWQFTLEITPPYGPEMFKAIATKDPADFSALIDPPTAGRIVRGEVRGNKRGALEAETDIGKLLLGAAAPKLTRGDSPFINFANISSSRIHWATTEISFEAAQGSKTEFPKAEPCQ